MKFKALSLACLAIAWPGQAKNFGEHGGYEVAAIEGTSADDRGGCVMAEDDFEGPGGTRLRLFRFVSEPTLIAVTLENYNWTSKKEEEYELKYDFDRYTYSRTAMGTVDGIYHGFMAFFPYDDFSKTLAASSYLHVYRDKIVVDKLSLNGSAAGVAAFERCWRYILADDLAKQRERARWKEIPKDPFAKSQP